MNEMPNLPAVDYCCTFDPQDTEMGCICGDSERVLRAVKLGKVSLTGAQREWCLSEIGRVEGYDRREHESNSDPDLAYSVLCAWTDYARDKGLL